MPSPTYGPQDFVHSPFVVFYEVTQACALACKHCRATAQPCRHPFELSDEDSIALVDDFARFPRPPLLVLTGGDPLERPNLRAIVRRAVSHDMQVALTPSATPRLTQSALEELRDAGLGRIAVSLDGADAATHDGFRGAERSFARTLQAIADARSLGLPVQVNTTVSRHNVGQIDAMAELLAENGIVLWSVFFLVPVGRATVDQRISPEDYELVFERLWTHAQTKAFAIKTTEAPHYRRFVMLRRGDPRRGGPSSGQATRRAPLGVNDGRGVMFVGHTGTIQPSGFLNLSCGRFPQDSVVEVYQRHPTFVALRDTDRLEGKCGRCPFRQVCGGSRARSYAMTGNLLAEEPDCVYQPPERNTIKQPFGLESTGMRS